MHAPDLARLKTTYGYPQVQCGGLICPVDDNIHLPTLQHKLQTLQKILSGVVSEHLHVPDISHYRFWVAVPRDFHDLVGTRIVNSRTGHKACPQ